MLDDQLDHAFHRRASTEFLHVEANQFEDGSARRGARFNAALTPRRGAAARLRQWPAPRRIGKKGDSIGSAIETRNSRMMIHSSSSMRREFCSSESLA